MARTSFQLEERRTRLLEAPVPKVLFDLSWPMTLGLFSVIAINVTDTFYIGQLGGQELAAIGFCFPVIFGMSAIAIGMGNGGAAVVSRAIGAGREGQARSLISSTLIFVTLFAIVLALIMLQVSDTVFLALGAPRELLQYINQFMTIWYIGLPLLVAPIVLNGLIRATGEAKVPSVLMVLAAVINAVISPFIIFGLFGLPALGMSGAAIATVTARLVITVMAIMWLFRESLIEVSASALKTFLPCTLQVLRYGAPAFFAQLSSPIAGAIVTRIIAESGPDAVAGFAVGARIEALVLIPFFALQTGVTPFIGQNVGADNTARLRQAEGSIWAFAGLWGAVGAAILFCFGGSLSGLFTDNPAIAATGDAYLEAIAFGLWGAGLLAVSIGVFNPLGYPNLALAANALRYVGFYAGGALVAVTAFGVSGQDAVFFAASLSYIGAGLAAAFLVRLLLERPNRKDLGPVSAPAPKVAQTSTKG
ncbi:MATE family efflux transporter [Parvularcula sp. ZS-1/3]|uniref:MATE family efflux transporter n=1 Tax=Parvularcula mediterranea TaxID=2732508 RepID=A0A7Y3RJB8_9PROT|nr:MATE family efflux transporter [Parvularcula mediterranea]NNU15122.1 MATE family efflux transporter [Parvularcula mediterranea]